MRKSWGPCGVGWWVRAMVVFGLVGTGGGAEWKEHLVVGEAGFQHAGEVSEIVPLPDGKRVLTASGGGTARLWDLATGRELRRYARDDSGMVWGVALLPGGQEFLTAGSGGFVTRWELATGKKLMTYEHEGTVFRLALRPGGKEFVAVDNKNVAVLWDLESGVKVRTFKGHTDSVYTAVFVAGGDRLVTGGSDGKLKLWNVESGKCVRTLKEDFEEIFTLALSPDRTRIALCSDDERVCLYAAESLKLIWSVKDAGEMKVVGWSPDGKRVAAANDDEELVIWDAGDGAERKRISLPGRSHRGVAFSLDGRELYSGGDRVMFRHALESGERLIPERGIPVLRGGVEAVVLSPDGGMVLATGGDDAVQAWETATGEQRQRFEGPKDSEAMAVSPDGRLLAMGGAEGEVFLLESTSGTQMRKLVREKKGGKARGGNGFRGRVKRVDFDLTGERLVASSRGHEVALWDVASGEERQIFSGHEDRVNDVSFASEETIITASHDKTVRIWEVRGGKEVTKVVLPDDEPESVVSLEGGRSFLVSTHDEEIHGFLSAPREERPALEAAMVESLVAELGADRFAVRRAASVKLVEQGMAILPILDRLHPNDPEVVFRLREIRAEVRRGEVGGDLKLLHAFDRSVGAMASAPGGAYWAAVVGSGASARIVIGTVEDQALKIGKEFADGHGPETVCFSQDGKSLAAGNNDGTVSVFRLK